MDSNITSCHGEAGLNSDSDNDISPLLIFAIKKRSKFSIFSFNDLFLSAARSLSGSDLD